MERLGMQDVSELTLAVASHVARIFQRGVIEVNSAFRRLQVSGRSEINDAHASGGKRFGCCQHQGKEVVCE